MKTYWLVRIGELEYVGKLGVTIDQRRKAYKFRSSAHADRVRGLTATAYHGTKVRVVGPFTEDGNGKPNVVANSA